MKNNKGITLIALIITIIVMLILAGVSINMVIGENGVITKAEEAKKIQEEARIEENIDIGILAAVAEGKGKIETIEQLEKQFVDGYNITKVTGENTTEKGYIIEDLNNEKNYYVDENAQKRNAKIIDSSELNKEFSWQKDATNKRVNALKYINSEYDGTVKFPDYIRYGDELYGINNIVQHKNYKFSEIILPIRIANLNQGHMFDCCENLRKIEIGLITEGEKKVPGWMLANCTNLREVVFDKSNIETILGNAFQNCTSLETIKLPESLTVLAATVFNSCENLKYVYVEKNIKNIIPNAFIDCTGLEKIQINKTVEEIRKMLNAEQLIEKYEYTKGKVYDKDGNRVTF